ncbi:MAG: exodeoxyribonuclease VII large subunit [Myxococcota bacterium]
MQPTPPGSSALESTVSVRELTFALKRMIEGEFGAVAVEGEASNVKRASSGHVYFTLKDADAQISCVMWRSTAQRASVQLQDGMQVVAFGDVQVYAPQGKYQLIVSRLRESGLGTLLVRLEELKRRLHDEGLFDLAKKRALPFLPRRIGVVTAPTGAAIRDILTTLHRRYPAQVLLYPCKVQGPGSAEAIARGIEVLGALSDIDVLIVGRGGGSIEDLWAFNEEIVVRAVAACPKPVVSAVGHEVDTLLSDWAADARAATPTAAAELVVPDLEGLRTAISDLEDRLERAARRAIERARAELSARRARLADPRRVVAERQQRLDELAGRLEAALRRRTSRARERHAKLGGRLHNLHPRLRLRAARADHTALIRRLRAALRQRLIAERRRVAELDHSLRLLSPTHSLERGYAIVRDASGGVLRASQDAAVGQPLSILLHRGALDAVVERVVPRHAWEAEPSDP